VPGWAAFTGLTLLVLFVFLALARLSQGVVDDEPPQLPPGEEDAAATRADDHERDGDASVGPSTPDGGATAGAGEAVTITGDVETGPETAAVDGETAETETETEPWDEEPRQPQAYELTTAALLANVAVTQGLFGAIVAAAAWYFEIPATALGLAGGPLVVGGPAVGLGVVFGVLLWTGNEMSATIADAVGAGYDESLREMLAPDSIGGWVVLLGVILPIIAVVEELIFRAALIGVPAAGFGVSPWALAVFSSAMFALGHGAQGRVGIAVTGGLGFVLAGGYILSGSLLVVVVAHYLVNALEFVVHEGLGANRLLTD
jgi:membrane protease YdiL (CAAX protease family)